MVVLVEFHLELSECMGMILVELKLVEMEIGASLQDRSLVPLNNSSSTYYLIMYIMYVNNFDSK